MRQHGKGETIALRQYANTAIVWRLSSNSGRFCLAVRRSGHLRERPHWKRKSFLAYFRHFSL